MTMQPDPISEPLFPNSASARWSMFLTFAMIAVLLFFGIFASILYKQWGAENAMINGIVGFLLAGLLVSPFCMLLAIVRCYQLRRKAGNVQFDGETISVFEPALLRYHAAKLTDCRWFVGSRTWATIPAVIRGNMFSIETGEAILIVFPDSVQTEYRLRGKRSTQILAKGTAIAAVGLNIETRFQWEQAIERLNVQRDVDREALAPPISPGFFMFWTILAFPLSFVLGLLIANTTQELLILGNIPADIARGISFPLIVPGVIYLLYFVAILPSFWRTQPDIYQVNRDRSDIQRIKRNCIIGICVTHGVVIHSVWGMNKANDWTERAMIAATVVCVIMALAAIVALWRWRQADVRADDTMSE